MVFLMIKCSLIEYKGVNKKEHQRSLVVSGFFAYAYVHALEFHGLCVCFECELAAL